MRIHFGASLLIGIIQVIIVCSVTVLTSIGIHLLVFGIHRWHLIIGKSLIEVYIALVAIECIAEQTALHITVLNLSGSNSHLSTITREDGGCAGNIVAVGHRHIAVGVSDTQEYGRCSLVDSHITYHGTVFHVDGLSACPSHKSSCVLGSLNSRSRDTVAHGHLALSHTNHT